MDNTFVNWVHRVLGYFARSLKLQWGIRWDADGGKQIKWVVCQDFASATDGWVAGKILDADGSSLAGTYYIEYVGK